MISGYTTVRGAPVCERVRVMISVFMQGCYIELGSRELANSVALKTCKECRNHILRLGGGKCWELGYEETD